MTVTEGRLMADVVAAFVRSIRAMGYYDDKHPVFEATRREAHSALMQAFELFPVVTLGCGGRHLLIDEDGGTLTDPPAAALAQRMFENAVVAVRIRPDVRAEDLGVFMQVLAEREDRVRAAGGVASILERQGTVGIEILEVDIEALFSGRQDDLGIMVDNDPVVELALRAILRFRDEEQNSGGEALQVSLEKVGTPASLGSFLDELLGNAEPGVVDGDAAEGNLTGDDFADLASQAFLRSHDAGRRSSSPASDIAQSAELLSNALVRLSPDARFALLRRLAGADELSDEQALAVRDLGAQLNDSEVTSAIASALVDQQGDPATVRSIGNLIRRIRPVEAERQRLLAEVDQFHKYRRGRPIDGVLWQEMQSRAFENGGLGLLEMSLAQTSALLKEYAGARRVGRLPAVPGQDVLHTVDDNIIDYWTTFALVDVLHSSGRLGPGATEACRLQLDRLDLSGASDECASLLEAMMRRTDQRDDEPELNAILINLLEGPRGPTWSLRLLHHEGRPSQMMGDILLAALDRPGDRSFKEALIDRLARFDHDTLGRLINRSGRTVSPFQAQSLVLAALRHDAKFGVRAVRSS